MFKQASSFPVRQSFSALLLPAVASFAQQDFSRFRVAARLLSFAAISLRSLSLQQPIAFLLLLVPSEQKDTSLPSLARQQAGCLIIRELRHWRCLRCGARDSSQESALPPHPCWNPAAHLAGEPGGHLRKLE